MAQQFWDGVIFDDRMRAQVYNALHGPSIPSRNFLLQFTSEELLIQNRRYRQEGFGLIVAGDACDGERANCATLGLIRGNDPSSQEQCGGRSP